MARERMIFSIAGLVWGSFVALIMMSVVKGDVLLSSLPNSLVVTADVQNIGNHPAPSKAGEDHIAVQWSLNSSFAGKDTTYSTVTIDLCFAPPSQINRAWRKTKDDLSTDKTCLGATIASQKYTSAGNSTVWMISREVPKAFYFVRAYAVDANGVQVAYGQTTNKAKTTNIFQIEGISGKTTSMDIASAVFSVFAVGALVSYLAIETALGKRKARLSGEKSSDTPRGLVQFHLDRSTTIFELSMVLEEVADLKIQGLYRPLPLDALVQFYLDRSTTIWELSMVLEEVADIKIQELYRPLPLDAPSDYDRRRRCNIAVFYPMIIGRQCPKSVV